MSSFPLSASRDDYEESSSLMGTRHATAGIVCLLGILFQILLQDPIMATMGIAPLGEAGGNFLTKIHPGVYFIYMSFVILLLDRGQPLRKLAQIYREHKVFCLFALLLLLLFFYWILREPKGAGLLIDTHLPVPIAAIVLSYTPRSICRRAVKFLVAFAVVNSMIGIAESLGRFRIYAFDPDWPVLKEDQFRASALLGHPLNNAVFTALVIFVVSALRGYAVLRTAVIALFIVSLVAFGGRSALVFSLLGLGIVGINALRKSFRSITLLKLFVLMALVILAPALLFGALYAVLTSSMGERLMAVSSFTDDSAAVRTVVFHAFDFMTKTEILFGVSFDRIEAIIYKMGLNPSTSDIENPWVLMIMQLGLVFFAAWLLTTLAFIRELMRDKSFVLRLAVLAYFTIASSFNSFGRKDFLYTLMVASVVCVSRGFETKSDRGVRFAAQTKGS